MQKCTTHNAGKRGDTKLQRNYAKNTTSPL